MTDIQDRELQQAQQMLRRKAIQSIYPDNPVDALPALEAVVQNNGDLTMAALDLNTSPQRVLAAVVGSETNHDLLSKYLRAYTTIKNFEVVDALQGAVLESIPLLKPAEAAKIFVQLVQGMANLTDTKAASAPMDPFAALMRASPPHIREAILTLIPGGRDAIDSATADMATDEISA